MDSEAREKNSGIWRAGKARAQEKQAHEVSMAAGGGTSAADRGDEENAGGRNDESSPTRFIAGFFVLEQAPKWCHACDSVPIFFLLSPL